MSLYQKDNSEEKQCKNQVDALIRNITINDKQIPKLKIEIQTTHGGTP